MNLSNNDLSNWNFNGQNIKETIFCDSTINGANFSGTTYDGFFTSTQLYSTKSYKSKDLSNINLSDNDLRNWELDNMNLQNANLDFTEISGTNFSNADLRGANMEHIMGSYTVKNTIMSEGVIQNFSMNSSADSFSIHKYTPLTEDGEAISAKIAQNASIMGGAELTLETGACLEVVDGAVLSLEDGSSIMVNTDVDASTLFEINENSGLVFEAGAVLEINLDETVRALDAYTFSVITWQENSSIAGLDSLVKGETLLLSINGERFSGNWDYVLSNNQFAVSLQIPEPSTYAAIFGVLAIAFAAYRRRK